MLTLILPAYHFALTYTQKLVADIPDDQFCAQPVPSHPMNHAAFTLGHLAWANDNALTFLHQQPQLARLKDLFGMGTKPLPTRTAYPSKPDLLSLLESAHTRLATAVSAATRDQLSAPSPERMRPRFPTTAHLLAGLMTSHYSSHIGQLSAWRRALGHPSVF